MTSGAIRRFQERVIGPNRTGLPSTTSDVWLLGVCYKISEDEASGETDAGSVLAAFKQDFSSRILITYRKGFEPIKDTNMDVSQDSETTSQGSFLSTDQDWSWR